jgi:hypothetical protein
MLDFEEEEIWIRHRLRRMRALLRYAKEIKVEVGLRELIAEAEERLEILEQRQTLPTFARQTTVAEEAMAERNDMWARFRRVTARSRVEKSDPEL